MTGEGRIDEDQSVTRERIHATRPGVYGNKV